MVVTSPCHALDQWEKATLPRRTADICLDLHRPRNAVPAVTMGWPRVQPMAKEAALRERKRERDRFRKANPVFRQRNAEAMRIRRKFHPKSCAQI